MYTSSCVSGDPPELFVRWFKIIYFLEIFRSIQFNEYFELERFWNICSKIKFMLFTCSKYNIVHML
jgi:hypothetical protein